jgi:hypothetical protein
VGGQRHVPGRFIPQERDPLLVVQEAGWAPGAVWSGAENFVHTGIRSSDLPVRGKWEKAKKNG